MGNDPITNAAIAGAFMGGVIGILPLFIGIRYDNFIMGGTGFALAAAAGVFFGWYGAVPMALIFAVITYARRKK